MLLFVLASKFPHPYTGTQFRMDATSKTNYATTYSSAVDLLPLLSITHEVFQITKMVCGFIWSNATIFTVTQPFHTHPLRPTAPKQRGCRASNLDGELSCSLAAFIWSSPALQVEGDLLLPVDIQLRHRVQYLTVQSNMLRLPESCSSERHLLIKLPKSFPKTAMLRFYKQERRLQFDVLYKDSWHFPGKHKRLLNEIELKLQSNSTSK